MRKWEHTGHFFRHHSQLLRTERELWWPRSLEEQSWSSVRGSCWLNLCMCFILFSQQFYEYHLTCRYNLSLFSFHGRENWGVEKLFTQHQTTSTWLSRDPSPNCLTGRASVSHNGHLVVPSETGNCGFQFQEGLIQVNSLLLPAPLSFFVSQESESDWGSYCLVRNGLWAHILSVNPSIGHWAKYTYLLIWLAIGCLELGCKFLISSAVA